MPDPNAPITFPIDQLVAIPKTNYRSRGAELPIAVAIHIAEGSRASVISTFQDPTVGKSSHFLVCRDGKVVQFVSTKDASFCTGNIDNPINELVLTMPTNPNGWTISIEHEGFSTADITPAQYDMTARIVEYCHKRWGVPMDRTHVFGHREAYSKKTCPGLINIDTIVQKARLI